MNLDLSLRKFCRLPLQLLILVLLFETWCSTCHTCLSKVSHPAAHSDLFSEANEMQYTGEHVVMYFFYKNNYFIVPLLQYIK